jgi:hypothetical protein
VPCVRQVAQRLGQPVEGLVVVERAGQELHRPAQPGPGRLEELGAGALLRRLAGERLEVAVAPVAPGEAEQREAGRQQPAVGQVVDRRDELLAGQVARDAEDDQRARVGDPRQPAVAGGAERVLGRDRHG